MNEKILYIEGIRGLLCLWVVLFHFTERYSLLFDLNNSVNIPYGGAVGVALFFFLSGYFTIAGIQKIDQRGSIVWFLKKVSRLYPAYLVSVVLCYFFLTYLGLPGREPHGCLQFILNMLGFPLFNGDLIEGAHWYLFALLKFYVYAYLIYRIGLSFDWKIYTILLICSVTLSGIDGLGGVKYHLLLNNHLDVLLVSMVYYNFERKRNKIWTSVLLLSLASIYYIHGAIVFVASVILLLVLNIKYLQIPFNSRVLVFLGEISYTWYLLHQNIGFSIIYNINTRTGADYAILIALLLTFVLSLIVHYFVELPILKIISNQFKKYESSDIQRRLG